MLFPEPDSMPVGGGRNSAERLSANGRERNSAAHRIRTLEQRAGSGLRRGRFGVEPGGWHQARNRTLTPVSRKQTFRTAVEGGKRTCAWNGAGGCSAPMRDLPVLRLRPIPRNGTSSSNAGYSPQTQRTRFDHTITSSYDFNLSEIRAAFTLLLEIRPIT